MPTCEICNGEKSRLEHYLTTVLPFGSQRPDIITTLENSVAGRLRKNHKLHRDLAKGMTWVLTERQFGVPTPTVALPFDVDPLHKLIGYIVRGLLWYHWSVLLQAHHDVQVLSLTTHGAAAFANRLGLKVNQRVTGDFGSGTFLYEGIQSAQYAELSVWRFIIFNGLKLGGDPGAPSEESTVLIAFTGGREFVSRLIDRID